MSDNSNSIDGLEQLANQSRLKTFDAALNTVQNALEIDGKRINLGLCTGYEEYYGGDVQHYTFRCGPYEVEIKEDRRKMQGTQHVVEVEDVEAANSAGDDR
jgi:hypothetical protein